MTREFGYIRYLVTVDLPANTTRTVEFDVVGQVDPNLPYDLSIWHQPLVNNDQMSVTYHGPDGLARSESFELVEHIVLFAPD